MRDPNAGKSTFATMVILSALASLTLVATHGDASACGGLFCNARPPDPFAPLPVAQAGENVVFSITKDPAGGAPTLQAHIQILYNGDAAKFSWVVPVDADPGMPAVGTDRLFAQLNTLTAPRFTMSQQTEGTCIPQSFGGSGGSFGSGSAGTSGAAGATGAGGGGGSASVNVTFQGAVGPFEAATLKSDDPTALKTWLTTNGYVISDAAAGLIDVYVRENKYFVALKLLNGVGVKSIQPIVLTFRGVEACVPLRLTAIAANPDMPVLVWVLSDKRVAPRGYFEIKIDDARIDWFRQGSNYFGAAGLVSLAANEAGGNAFATEYAGPSSIARAQIYQNGQINLTTLRTAMTPPVYVQQLISMGLANDPLTLPLLAKYIPMPDAVKAMNITDNAFYNNISFYWSQYAFPPYDLTTLTDEISAKIVTPRINAQMMIDGHPYLTRLNTFISPEEMNKDPFFFETRDLTDVPNVHTAVLRTMCGNMEYMSCNAPQRLELPDGRMVWVRAGLKGTTCMTNPQILTGLQKLPAAEVAWQRAETGQGTRAVDNTAAINNGIAAINATFPAEQTRFPIPTGAGGSTGTAGTGGGTPGTAGTGGAGPGTAGTGGSAGPGTAGTGGGSVTGTGGAGVAGADGLGPSESNGGGCSCATAGFGGGARFTSIALAGVIGLTLLRRRRRAGR
jgi:MYXO-CTERM domain-containing protein